MKLTIIFLFLTFPAWAGNYKLNGRFYHVQFEKGITASPRCFTEKSCDAIKEAKKLKKEKLPTTAFGKNPFSKLCKETLKAEMVMGSNDKGDEESFCRFKVDSVISCASLREFMP